MNLVSYMQFRFVKGRPTAVSCFFIQYIQGGNKVLPGKLNNFKNYKGRATKLGTTLLGIKAYFNTYSVIR